MRVNFIDLPTQYKNYKNELLNDIDKTITDGSFIGCTLFENKFAFYHGIQHCVGVGSGTDALLLSLLSLNIRPGDEVIVPANTYIATAFAVSHTGAMPMFIDPNPDTYTIEASSIEKAITSRTKAIIPVHLYGCPADMWDIIEVAKKYNLFIIEDCAQATGALYNDQKVGTFGDVGCFSFYPTKNLGGLGQGGMIITGNDQVATITRELGNVGRATGDWYSYNYVGYNSRLDKINAIFLEHGLNNLRDWNLCRQKAAELYINNLSTLQDEDYGIKLPKIPHNVEHVFHLFEFKCGSKERRDSLKGFLEMKDIFTGLHYPIPCHRQPMYVDYNYKCPIADDLSDTLISLPMHPSITVEEINYVSDSIKEFFELDKNNKNWR